MKQIKDQPIVIPMEFKVACSIYKVKMVDVLQIFVDHVTLYDLMNKTYHQGFSEACHTVKWYLKKNQKPDKDSKGMKNCKRVFDENMRQIEILANMKRRGWKTTIKRGYTHCFVQSIFESMERIYTPSDLLYLDEFSTVKLSRDFCVICEASNCYPIQFLEYFMKYISVADAHACEWVKGYTNFIYSFFLMVANGFGGDPSVRLNLTDSELDFYDRMEELRLEVYVIRDIIERAEILRGFYLSHYQSMNPNQS